MVNEAPVRPPPRLRLYRVAPGRPAGLTQSRQHRCQRHLPRQLRLNQAAGDAQQQSNVRVVAVGPAALVGSDQRQHLQLDASQPIAASASISGALRGSGILGVNQGAGLGNQQINAFRLSVSNGPESLDDSVLAQSVALTKSLRFGHSGPGRTQRLDGRSRLAGSSGVVQVNQSAGVGNQSMNTLSVRVME
ncbi:adhesin [Pseudomonas aeruginosa]|nr:adhesin [Pseudomonas aeruginosa]